MTSSDGSCTQVDKLLAVFSQQPTISKEIYEVANAYSKAGRYEKANRLYKHVVEHWPGSTGEMWAKMDMAKTDIGLGNYTAAEKTIDILITDFNDNPELPTVIFMLGEEYYEIAIRHENEIFENQAREFYQKAIAIWGKMIQELQPNANYTPRAYYCSAVVYSQELADHQKGIEYFQKIVDNWPKYKYAWDAQFLIGRSYEALRKSGSLPPSEADAKIQQAYQAVIEKYPDSNDAPYAALKLGQMSFRASKWPDAAYYFELFLQKNRGQTPNLVYVNTLYDLGRAYEQMGELDAAVQTYRSFIQVAEPSDPRKGTVKTTLEKLEGVKK